MILLTLTLLAILIAMLGLSNKSLPLADVFIVFLLGLCELALELMIVVLYRMIVS